ncbi:MULTISPECIES: efflux RND transporter periplasmic adaptor subunit [Halomonas]|uniref:efflux RND transporter periplasmic adaptor subunit n=1 Tax=Halomonas TaxID=2745 RepID=UPI001A8C59F8|nr:MULTISPECIES: efflux RND transporter periplasmic adaptor subunit [Halomonas]MED5293951.1 efflux RND transporter periplasmic adaptor subunit [Pseudomonadota bacterium]MBN8412012.1 efflux RND transporter periplasmic adaptor subunit [Halomonas litopenaei]MBY5930008.1 efflux RND transporter periplasmic adaptor subunit [Halomonas sp. DP8Y7-3]MBY5969973.1 efflux RND transporter periplasmic adaptor subunit [Halomonas denitrificans]MBY5985670.1 efflux RND transporter periplasmic adaptor subunit [Ha
MIPFRQRLILRRRSLVATLLAVVVIAGCEADQPPLTQQQVHPVKLVALDAKRQGMLMRYPGQVQASERSELSFRVGGELRELAVQPGDEVEAGDLIARLDDRDAESQLASARSSYSLAEATYERMRISLERGAISRSRFDEARAEYLSAQAQLKQAQDQVSYTELTAPFSGVIASVPVDNYQVVTAQQTIAELQQPGSIDVTFQLPEQQVRRINDERAQAVQDGDEAVVWVTFAENQQQRYPARYKEHDSSVSQGSLSYEVTLTLPEPEDITVLSGMSATVLLDMSALTGDSRDPWRVPVAAVTTRESAPEQPVVWRFVPDDPAAAEGPGKVEAVPVTPGPITTRGMLIEGELEAGDRLVAAGAERMQEGRQVRPWIKEEGL